MAAKWIKIYDLANDHELVSKIQMATLETEDFGLVPEVALFGSKDWWKAIKKGIIPKHELVGIISRVYMSGHNDWPEVEIKSDEEKTVWTRIGDDKYYEVGRKIKLEYVIQKAKKSWTGCPYQKEVIKIYVLDNQESAD
jgi:hypothetical protein